MTRSQRRAGRPWARAAALAAVGLLGLGLALAPRPSPVVRDESPQFARGQANAGSAGRDESPPPRRSARLAAHLASARAPLAPGKRGGRAHLPLVGERLSPSTRILQLSVGNERVALLASVHKPSLPYHQPSPAGDFNLRVTDADGRSYERDFQAQGLIPARIPQAWLDPDGAWREGDTLRLPEVPVLIKLPGDLRAPLRCRVLGHGRQLGEWTVPS